MADFKRGQTVEVVDDSAIAGPGKARKFPFAKGQALRIDTVKMNGSGAVTHLCFVGRPGMWKAHRFEVRGG